MSGNEFQKIADKVTVYARTTPRHKLRIVEALQARGDIVAMTGDGVNDAPALKKADIGIAMGRCGTEVAKEASEIVLKDDNFTTIVIAIKEGRTIYSNIKKFIYYMVAGNFSEVTLILIAALLGVVPPLTPLMILFINLVTSDFPALGLCLEKPSPNIMKQKPRDPKEGILSDYLLLKIGIVVPWIILGTIALFMWELVVKSGTVPKAQTMAFATLILFELFHIFNAKSFDESVFSKRTFANPALFLSFGFSLFCTLVVIYWQPAQAIFGTLALSIREWVSITIMASMVVVWVEVQKSIVSSEIKEREKMEIYTTRR
jgi:Ca2+-transporting ATPase